MGRPPAGDAGEEVQSYPRLSLWMKPALKAQLTALSSMTGQPAWRIIDQALSQHIKALPAADRRALEGLAQRVEARNK
jgi:hypothetical protein